MVRMQPARSAEEWTGPVMVRGWLRIRSPWRHPFAVLTLFRKWMRVRRDVERADGFLWFEYWQRLESLLFGMHVGWSNREKLALFDDYESHRDIAKWAIASKLVIAMKLQTMAKGEEGRIIDLGGFYICFDESDLAADALFPNNGESA
jgi:hypothetical protein